jgi:hypothetical protein
MWQLWLRYQTGLQRCSTWCSVPWLQACSLCCLVCCAVLFIMPQRSEWLLLPLLILLWSLMLLLVKQLGLKAPNKPLMTHWWSRLKYGLNWLWYQLMSLFILLLTLLCLAFSLKLAGVILRALVA